MQFSEGASEGALEGAEEADVLQTAAALREEADRRLTGRLDAMQQRGAPASCAPGCTACCRQFVVVSPMEALALADFARRNRSVASRRASRERRGRLQIVLRLYASPRFRFAVGAWARREPRTRRSGRRDIGS